MGWRRAMWAEINKIRSDNGYPTINFESPQTTTATGHRNDCGTGPAEATEAAEAEVAKCRTDWGTGPDAEAGHEKGLAVQAAINRGDGGDALNNAADMLSYLLGIPESKIREIKEKFNK